MPLPASKTAPVNPEQINAIHAEYREALCGAAPGLRERLDHGTMLPISGLMAVADRYRAVILDAFGVLYSAGAAVPGATETITELRRAGLALRVLTNNASHSPQQLAQRFAQLGFDLQPEEIITSGGAVYSAAGLAILGDDPYLYLGRPDSVTHYAPHATERMVNHPESTLPWSQAATILICSDSAFYGTDLQPRLEALLSTRSRPLIVANPDLVSPSSKGGLKRVAGMTAHLLHQHYGGELIYLGKPFAPVFQQCLESLPGIEPQQMLMVGDTIETDILGSIHMGMESCLVHQGIHADRSLEALETLCRSQGIHPNWVTTTIRS
ncbi:MAG: TIGR01459 family HAD-type hydrolase [Magnetococcales bacterium]|nr:TIGR01459 family HAD-type hydrolase [Magnetococcales bacterium]